MKFSNAISFNQCLYVLKKKILIDLIKFKFYKVRMLNDLITVSNTCFRIFKYTK